MGIFDRFGKWVKGIRRKGKESFSEEPKPIRVPHKKDIDKPVPVGPEEEKEEEIRKEKVSTQDDFDVGKEAMVALKEHLEKEGYKGVRENSYVYDYDGTIDYEVRIPLRKGDEKEVRAVFLDVEDFFQAPARYMVSTGFRVPSVGIEDVEDNYLVLEGQVILGAHYQTSDRLNVNIQTSLVNYEGLIRNGREMPTEIFVRLFYNPVGSPPNRDDYSNGIIKRDEAWETK